MPLIELVTDIAAPPERCFDLSCDLDLHQESFAHTSETIVAGRTSGRIEMGEEVTWRARHFGFTHEHTAKITAHDRPRHFRDEMIRGRFRRFVHDHYFEPGGRGTIMRDVLDFASPLGWLGKAVDSVILTRYLKKLLEQRNAVIRDAAERTDPSSRRT